MRAAVRIEHRRRGVVPKPACRIDASCSCCSCECVITIQKPSRAESASSRPRAAGARAGCSAGSRSWMRPSAARRDTVLRRAADLRTSPASQRRAPPTPRTPSSGTQPAPTVCAMHPVRPTLRLDLAKRIAASSATIEVVDRHRLLEHGVVHAETDENPASSSPGAPCSGARRARTSSPARSVPRWPTAAAARPS